MLPKVTIMAQWHPLLTLIPNGYSELNYQQHYAGLIHSVNNALG